jgi:LCP family protein required for cell wall assembly
MLLLCLDRNGKKLRLLSLPRDTMVNRDNPVPKLNGAYGANGRGEKGMNVLMDYVKDLVGYRPDGYMLLDLVCFEELVDAMGGVSFDVPMDMSYNDPSQDLYIDLKQGTQTLTGQEAMWLVRFRSGYAMADLERVKVQRDFLDAAIRQWKSLTRLPRAPYAALLLLRNAETDLSWRNLSWIALSLVRGVSGGFESDTLPGEPKYVNGGAYYVEDRQAAAELVNEKYNPYEKEIRADELHPYGY